MDTSGPPWWLDHPPGDINRWTAPREISRCGMSQVHAAMHVDDRMRETTVTSGEEVQFAGAQNHAAILEVHVM